MTLVAEPGAAGGLGLVWTYCTAEEAVSNGVPWEEAGGPVADLLHTAHDAEIAAVCKKGTDGTVRVSLRSRDRIDVGEIAAGRGGGGTGPPPASRPVLTCLPRWRWCATCSPPGNAVPLPEPVRDRGVFHTRPVSLPAAAAGGTRRLGRPRHGMRGSTGAGNSNTQ